MRDVLALNGQSTVRFRPSAPTASFTVRILSRDVAKLPQLLELRLSLAHVLKRLALHVELAALKQRPVVIPSR